MRRWVSTAALLALAGAACDVHEAVVIPDGAQVVRVVADDAHVALAPAAVSAGEVYLVLEGPNPDLSVISRATGPPGASAEGMTVDQVQRLRQGDYQSTVTETFAVSCGTDEWTAANRWEGCGENVRLTLAPGLHVVMTGADEPGTPPTMAVLEVTP
jgi:hypothetical protein